MQNNPNSPNDSKTEVNKCLGTVSRGQLPTSVPEMAVAKNLRMIARYICDQHPAARGREAERTS